MSPAQQRHITEGWLRDQKVAMSWSPHGCAGWGRCRDGYKAWTGIRRETEGWPRDNLLSRWAEVPTAYAMFGKG